MPGLILKLLIVAAEAAVATAATIIVRDERCAANGTWRTDAVKRPDGRIELIATAGSK